MTQALPCPLPARLAPDLPAAPRSGVGDARARRRAARGEGSAPGTQVTAEPCRDPSLGQPARPLNIWDLRVLRSYLARADHALTMVVYAAEEIPESGRTQVEARVEEVRRFVREAAEEIEALSAIVQKATAERERGEAKQGRR